MIDSLIPAVYPELKSDLIMQDALITCSTGLPFPLLATAIVGATATGTTSLSVAYPTTPPVAGAQMILVIANKYPTNAPTTPAGWTLEARASGGSGTSGVDKGSVYCSVYSKIAAGGETGNVAVTITSGNSSEGRIIYYTLPAGKTWSIATALGSDNTGGEDFSFLYDSDPGFRVGDMALVFRALNSDIASTQSGVMIRIPGCITQRLGTSVVSGTTSLGDDSRIGGTEFPILYGVSVGNALYSSIDSLPGTDVPAGASVLLRLRAA